MSIKQRLQRRMVPPYQHTARKLHELRVLFLELTHNCSLRCLHCGSDCVSDTSNQDLPLDTLLALLDELAEAYDQHKIMIMLSGGEPLLYPHVVELARAAHEREFPTGMVTNGWDWGPEIHRELKRARLSSVTVSVDGMEPGHDWMRNRKGSFQRAIGAVEMLLNDPFYRKMDVITCVTQRSFDELDELYELLSGMGLKAWRLFTISPIGRAPKVPELLPDEALFKGIMEKILEFRARGEMQVGFSESCYLGEPLGRKVRDFDFFCRAGISTGSVLVNGDIMACPNIDRHLVQGNIFRDSFVDVWENRYKEFRDRRWMRVGECAECREWPWCQGNSLHNWDLEAGRPVICQRKAFHLDDFSSPHLP